MAIWEVAGSTAWLSNRNLFSSSVSLVKADDGNVGETTFTVNESVNLTFSGNSQTFVGTYLGTLTVDGVAYPVVKWNNNWYAVGLDRSTSGIPTRISDSDIVATTFTVCFFPGTLIATPSGERKVEELASGDSVLVGDSGAILATWFGRKFARSVSVKWIGRQTVSTLFGTADRLMPVRFAAGSLGGWGGGGKLFGRITI